MKVYMWRHQIGEASETSGSREVQRESERIHDGSMDGHLSASERRLTVIGRKTHHAYN